MSATSSEKVEKKESKKEERNLTIPKSKKSTYIIAAVMVVLLAVGIYFLFVFRKATKDISPDDKSFGEIKKIDEIKLTDRPYVTLTPTPDGAEIIMSISGMTYFDKIEYELTYEADNPASPDTKIQRGATGSDVNTKDATYKKSILLGTASRGVRSPDRGILNGLLTMHLFKGDLEYLSESTWDMSTIGLTSNTIKTRDGNLEIEVPDLPKDYWVILANTIGIPAGGKFETANVQLPVYGAFSIAGAFPSDGTITIKERGGNKLFGFNNADKSWKELTASGEGGMLTAKISGFATYVVVSSK